MGNSCYKFIFYNYVFLFHFLCEGFDMTGADLFIDFVNLNKIYVIKIFVTDFDEKLELSPGNP